MTWRHVLAAWLVLCCTLPARAAEPLALDLVVMIRASRGSGSSVESGAGLIVSQTNVRTVIATALHVVRDEEQTNASHIDVEFATLRGKEFRATMAQRYFDAKSDLAILFIDHETMAAVPRLAETRFTHAVSPSPAQKLIGAAVHVVGATGRPWALGPPGDTVARVVDSRLRVKSAVASPGASGGATFDAFGRLLGMNSSIDTETGELVVVPMATIERRFASWGIEYALGTAGAPTGSDELLDVLRRTTRITIRATPGQTGSYAVTVAVPDALAKLKPTFRVVFPDMLTTAPFQMRAPDWLAQLPLPPERLNAQLWMDTPDGRTTGPVPQVLDVAALAATRIAEESARRRASEAQENREADPGELERAANREASRRAMEQAILENQRASTRMMEEHARESATKVAAMTASNAAYEAKHFESELLARILRDFPGWSLNCRPAKKPSREAIEKSMSSGQPLEQAWRCGRPNMLGREPVHGRIDAVVHSMRIGESARRLSIAVPVDHSVADVDGFVQTEVERLLSEGRSAIHVEIVLADGRRLGPKELCTVVRRSPSSLLFSCESAAGR